MLGFLIDKVEHSVEGSGYVLVPVRLGDFAIEKQVVYTVYAFFNTPSTPPAGGRTAVLRC